MKLLLQAVGAVAYGTHAVLSRVVDPARLDDVVVLHWCHLYRRHGMEPPPFIGMDNPPATPTTNAASNIQAYQFTANGSYPGGNNIPNITERGFAYMAGTTGDPVIANGNVFETGTFTGTGTFTWALPVTGLNADTSYRVRAYVINSVGTTYASNTITVTTDVIPAVAPTLLTPADNTSASGEEFTWTFNTDTGDTQSAFAFRRIIKTDLWEVRSGTPTLASTGYSAAFSPDGTKLAVAHSGSPNLTVINTSDWSVVSGTPTLPSTGRGAAFSPDGTKLAVAHVTSPFLTVINTSDWSVVSGTPTLAGTGWGAAFSPDGTKLAVAHDVSPFLTVINTSDWSVVSGTPTLAGTGVGVAFSPDGAKLAVGHSISPFLTVINTSDWSVVAGTPTLPNTGRGAAFSPDGTKLAVGHSTSPFLTVINTSDWSVVSGTPTLASTGWGAAFSPDGTKLAVGHSTSPFLTVIDSYVASYWNGTAWQDSEIYIPSTAQSLSLPGWEV